MRKCVVCGDSLAHRRKDARHCSGACRSKASRMRRILDGRGADGYHWLDDMDRARRRRRTESGHGV
jgi:hypothetical protein